MRTVVAEAAQIREWSPFRHGVPPLEASVISIDDKASSVPALEKLNQAVAISTLVVQNSVCDVPSFVQTVPISVLELPISVHAMPISKFKISKFFAKTS